MSAVRGHTLTLAAIFAGIVGFGLVYDGIVHGTMASFLTGVPLLFTGLWWAGRELGRSNDAAKRRGLMRNCSRGQD